ncbi:MAG: hypothetical protein NTY08_14625 [Proteobacteria bacterium]|nr:hypothetical protein [Pseudomonadota bacterium]
MLTANNGDIASFVRELNRFECRLSVTDKIWDIVMPIDGGRWTCIAVQKYRDTYYLHGSDRKLATLEYTAGQDLRTADAAWSMSGAFDTETSMRRWKELIAHARKWLTRVTRDWMQANRLVEFEYPLSLRLGTVPGRIVRELVPDIYDIARELGARKTRQVIDLVESGQFLGGSATEVETMTANRYFEYCRIAYIAAARKEDKVDKTLSGRAMYERYADRRDEGLLAIDSDSETEFADWLDGRHPKRTQGGHPWEIKRGGNTTHIDLSVYRPRYSSDKGYIIELSGESFSRMVETLKMLLTIKAAGMPISIANPEGVRHRLVGSDQIGIVPEDEYLHRANQQFDKRDRVFDVMHLSDLGRKKRKILPFIRWQPLPVLMPKR